MPETRIPAHCPICGAIFKSRLLTIGGNVRNLTLSNNKETCPHCGSMADTAEGVFDVADGVISIISAPEITSEMLEAFGAIVKRAYKEKSEPGQVIAAAEEIDPQLANLVRKALSSNHRFYLTVLLLLMFAIKSCQVNVDLDVNELIDQVSDQPPAELIRQ